MSYRIDEMTYLGGLEVPLKERKDVTNEINVGKWNAISEYWVNRMQPLVDKIMKDVEEDYKKLSDQLAPPLSKAIDEMRKQLDEDLNKNGNKMEEILKDIQRRLSLVEERISVHLDCDTYMPCKEIVSVQELLRNSKHLKDKTLVITKDNVCVL